MMLRMAFAIVLMLLAPAAALASGPLTQAETGALATARKAVAEMKALARTPEEKRLAAEDARYVDAVAALIARRAEARAAGGGQDQLLAETKSMQEMQMSFNLQYLQLQSQMQHENRSYTAVSNIMKTKHDTVKNSIGNIR